jgi:hypothetical protein
MVFGVLIRVTDIKNAPKSTVLQATYVYWGDFIDLGTGSGKGLEFCFRYGRGSLGVPFEIQYISLRQRRNVIITARFVTVSGASAPRQALGSQNLLV